MTTGKTCLDCRTLIGSSIANEPHVSLRAYFVKELTEGRIEYFECQACATKLPREHKKQDIDTRWRLFL
jgi:hypothetical protein